MSISDIKDELNAIRKNVDIKNNLEEEIKDTKIIQNNSIEQIESLLNSKIINIYQRPWSKLEIKLKKNKIQEYLDTQLSEEIIDKKQYNEKLESYNKILELNRKLKVEYDEEYCKIKNII